jgi:hypothetical protein
MKIFKILVILFVFKGLLSASDLTVDPQREDPNLLRERTHDIQFEENKNLEQEKMRGPQAYEDKNLQQEKTRDLQFQEDKFLQQERQLNR